MANYCVPPFIVKKVSKTDGFLIMFRNSTGDIYVLKNVSKELHNDPATELPKMGISPRYRAARDSSTGCFTVHSLSDFTGDDKILTEKIYKLINSADLSFLNEGFVSPEILVSIAMSNLAKLKGDEIQDLSLAEKEDLARGMVTTKLLDEQEELAKEYAISTFNSSNARNKLLSRLGAKSLPEQSSSIGKKSSAARSASNAPA
jgi:hypothetical protein